MDVSKLSSNRIIVGDCEITSYLGTPQRSLFVHHNRLSRRANCLREIKLPIHHLLELLRISRLKRGVKIENLSSFYN